MSTTLLDSVSAGATAGLSNGFRVALAAGGAVGVSVRVTTGGTDLAAFDHAPALHLMSSNFTDGPTAAADINAEVGVSGSVRVPLVVSATADDVRYTELSLVASGPVLYGYIDTPEALSANVTIEVEALEL